MNILEILEEAKNGKGIRLPYWDESCIAKIGYLDDEHGAKIPFLYLDGICPDMYWVKTTDLFHEDWEVVD